MSCTVTFSDVEEDEFLKDNEKDCEKSRKCVINPFPNKPWFLRICNTSLLKTL